MVTVYVMIVLLVSSRWQF